MHRRRTGILAAATIAIVATGCGTSGTSGGTAPTSSGAAPATVKVQVDGKVDAFNSAFLAYFPKELTVHPGDTVEFTSVFTGEPHTVTMGSLVDAGVPKAIAAGPDAQEEPPELAKIPSLLPDGPGNAIQATAQPCFLTSGDPPMSDACPKAQQTQPAYDGSQTYYNSGFLAEGDKFSVKLADTLKPGTYSFFCALHRAAMSGTITVADKATAVPSPAEVSAAGKKALADTAAKLEPVVTALRAGTLPPFIPAPVPGGVVAGGGSPDVPEGLVDEFGPKELSIPVGGSVTWTMIGPHSVAFNAPEDAKVPLNKAPDGSVNLNEVAVAPAGGPGAPPPPQGPPPEGPPGPPTVVDAGSWDGAGLRNSGLFLSFPPQLLAYKMTFSKAGSYPYVCTIHPEMKGTIKVG